MADMICFQVTSYRLVDSTIWKLEPHLPSIQRPAQHTEKLSQHEHERTALPAGQTEDQAK